MFIVKTSLRAFLFALLPLFFVHGVLLAMALLGSQANPPTMILPPPDKAFGMLMLRVALDAAGLAIGHFICRGLGVGSRAAYAMIGAVASASGYAMSLQQGLMPPPVYEGVTITAGILPTLAGMIAGFLYGQFAGRESLMRADSIPAGIATSTVTPANGVTATKPAPPAVFDGPVQVRTSIAAMFFASLLPSILIAVFFFAATYSIISGVAGGPDELPRFDWSRQIMALALPAQMFLITAMTTMIPGAIFIAIAHAVARGLRRTSGFAYAGAGALVGATFGIVLIPFGGMPSFPFTGVSFLILPLAAIGAIMMAIYRRFAGMEPRPLPEPVIATDLNALVPEDHPSRRYHAVVLNG